MKRKSVDVSNEACDLAGDDVDDDSKKLASSREGDVVGS